MCWFSRSHGTYLLLNAIGPFQCCITIEFRLPSDTVVTVLLQLLRLLWLDFLAISSLLFFFNDFPMAHKRLRNRNDTTSPAAINMPQIIIEIGNMVLSDGRRNVVVLVAAVPLRFSFGNAERTVLVPRLPLPPASAEFDCSSASVSVDASLSSALLLGGSG